MVQTRVRGCQPGTAVHRVIDGVSMAVSCGGIGHWHFEAAPDDLRTIRHVAGGQFLVTGAPEQG